MSFFAAKTAIFHLVFAAIDSAEDSNEPENTINVAAVDQTSSEP